jgi:hypothetical protein
MRTCIHHQPIDVPIAGAQTFFIDYTSKTSPRLSPQASPVRINRQRLQMQPGPKVPSKTRRRSRYKFLVTHPNNDLCKRCLTSAIVCRVHWPIGVGRWDLNVCADVVCLNLSFWIHSCQSLHWWPKIYYLELLCASEGTLNRWSRLHLKERKRKKIHLLAVASTHQPLLGTRGGYGPFSLCVIHKEGLCPCSGDSNKLLKQEYYMCEKW